jgi:tocopherol O-methyltransferase
MITCATVTKQAIQNHYDLATPFYRLLWGPHIHHGLWEASGTEFEAQCRLIDQLAKAASLRPGDRILDVGCGMGGSAIELASRGCEVTGVTLSPVQRSWARLSAACQGVSRKVRFLRADAEHLTFPAGSFDIVWNIECSEHLFDKPAFFRKCAHWLRPGGRVALCAWLAGPAPEAEPQVQAVCEGFLCPSLGTATDYRGWMEEAGLHLRTCIDLTSRVARTWEMCLERIRMSRVGLLAWIAGRNMQAFLDHFQTLLKAYRTGAMQYGLFVAEKAR